MYFGKTHKMCTTIPTLNGDHLDQGNKERLRRSWFQRRKKVSRNVLKFTVNINSQQKCEGENPTADPHDEGHFRNLRGKTILRWGSLVFSPLLRGRIKPQKPAEVFNTFIRTFVATSVWQYVLVDSVTIMISISCRHYICTLIIWWIFFSYY